MTLRHWLGSAFYFSVPLNSAHPRRTLSAIAKKPAALAGLLYLSSYLTRLIALFRLLTLLSGTPSLV